MFIQDKFFKPIFQKYYSLAALLVGDAFSRVRFCD